MDIDIGFPPIVTLLIALLVVAIVSDFLLELYSIRMSQSTGRIQKWFFESIGQNLLCDFLIATLFQLFSFRKKAYFLQFSSLVNVGSFTKKQIFLIVMGSQIGVGLSVLLLSPGYVLVGGAICACSFVFSLFWRDQMRDFGIALLALGLFLVSMGLIDPLLAETTFNVHNIWVSEWVAVGIVILTTLFFRTPIAFLLSLSFFHFFLGIQLFWLPVLYFLHAMTSSLRLYFQFFRKRKRLYFALSANFAAQCTQVLVSLAICWLFASDLQVLSQSTSFLSAFQWILLSFFVYSSLSLVATLPLCFLMSLLPFFNNTSKKKTGTQKIINYDQRGQCFSIHLSLFLLRQEFKKYTASVHTILKISRESDYLEEKINQKFMRYQGMLVRVGDELKELCFSIGRQRSYRWQVKEIMSYYKTVNQLELLVEDLSQVSSILRQKDLDEDWEKECRFWLGLQLKLFESFLNHTVGVGRDEPEKVKANLEKSYDILDRFFADKKQGLGVRNTSQTFYRITESIGQLAL